MNAQEIQIGQQVFFNGGFADGGVGAVVHQSISQDRYDIILEDGREFPSVFRGSLNRPGIGFSTGDKVYSAEYIANLQNLAIDRKNKEAQKLREEQERMISFESSRVIVDSPVFYWNGIKDAKGRENKLQKCWYSKAKLGGIFPSGTITVYANDYSRFSAKVKQCFSVSNDSDTMRDYFCEDVFHVIPSHPLYSLVNAAAESMEEKREKRFQARTQK